MFRFQFKIFLALVLATSLLITGCATGQPNPSETGSPVEDAVVNLYTDRHYDADDAIYQAFYEETGIRVNVVKGKSDELIERLKTEGADTEADLFIAADVGRLQRAKDADLLQPISSTILEANVPVNLRDPEQQWFGLTKRARVIVYAEDRVKPEELSSYSDLGDPKWSGRLLVRSSDSVYNQTLLASMIELNGLDSAKDWAKSIVANLARAPKGGDRDQAKAIVAGEGDIAIMNTYYVGLMLNSVDPEEVKVAEQLGVFFPDQNGTGTHINISGGGVLKAAKNKENAIKLMEYLSGASAQNAYAENNYEYPVNASVEPNALLKSWGSFKEQNLSMSRLGELNTEAVKVLGEVGWK